MVYFLSCLYVLLVPNQLTTLTYSITTKETAFSVTVDNDLTYRRAVRATGVHQLHGIGTGQFRISRRVGVSTVHLDHSIYERACGEILFYTFVGLKNCKMPPPAKKKKTCSGIAKFRKTARKQTPKSG